MSHLINIFLEPSKVFTELKEKPTFLLPLLLLVGFSSLAVLMYYMKVDLVWLVDNMFAAVDMPASELAKIKKTMQSSGMMANSMAFGATISVSLLIIIMNLIFVCYAMVAGKVSGTLITFKHGASLACWTAMPSVLGAIVGLIGVFYMDPRTTLESLQLTNVDPLFIQLPIESPWSMLAKGFSLLKFWEIFLIALGWKIWGKTSWLEAIIVASIPSLLVYGAMAAWALIHS